MRAGHDDFDGMAVGWALHALEPAEEEVFAEHMATCDRCQQLVRDSEEALGDLAYDVPMVDPPPQLLERIRHATGATDAMPGGPLRTEQEAEAPAPSGPVWPAGPAGPAAPEGPIAPVVPIIRRVASRRPRWAMPAIAAGLVLVAMLGWNVVLQNRVDEAQRLAAQRQSVINELGQSSTRAILTDPANRAVGYVVQRGSSIEIVAGGIAPNDRAKTTYVLWALPGSGEPPEAIGTFDVVRASMDVRPVNGKAHDPATFSGYAVSHEQGRTVPQRPTQVVATGAVSS